MTRLSRVIYWGEVIGWMAVILHLSGESFSASRTLIALKYWVAFFSLPIGTENLLLIHSVLRKGAHFGEFFVLGLLFYRALSGSLVNFHFRRVCWVLAVGFLFSIGDELHQMFSLGRTPSLRDSALDFAGILASQLWVYLRWQAMFKHRNVMRESR